jgi:hypothetical protein
MFIHNNSSAIRTHFAVILLPLRSRIRSVVLVASAATSASIKGSPRPFLAKLSEVIVLFVASTFASCAPALLRHCKQGTIVCIISSCSSASVE